MKRISIHVKAMWDDEAKVWVAQSEDVPGLITEAGTVEELHEKVLRMIPELLELNGRSQIDSDIREIPVHFMAEREVLRRAGCTFVRNGKGDHEIWSSPHSAINFTVDSKIKSRHTANQILKQAGLPKKF